MIGKQMCIYNSKKKYKLLLEFGKRNIYQHSKEYKLKL